MSLDVAKLRGYLAIDKHSLDDELIKQPELLSEIGEECANATAVRDSLKEELAVADALIASSVRQQLEKAKIRATDSLVKDRVQIDKNHTSAFQAYIKAKEHADVLLALKDAFHSRGYMLRDLCSLYVANYFEGNSVQGTDRTDSAVYHQQRDRMAKGRQARGK